MISPLLRIRNAALSWIGVARSHQERLDTNGDRPPVPPWPVMAIAVAVIVANLTMVFYGGQTTGISIDEPTHVERLQSYRESGWYVQRSQLSGGDSQARDRFVYGPVAAATAQWITEGLRKLGLMAPTADSADAATIDTSAAAYAVRHATVGLFSLLGLLGIAAISRRLFGSWRWGLLTAAALLAIPQWTGHSMFNIKDIPAASGFILVLLGLVSLGDPSAFSSRAILRTSVLALIGGLTIAMGTRPGMWPVIALMMLLTMVVTSMRAFSTSRRIVAARAAVLGGSAVVAYLLLLASYPKAFSTPFEAAWRAAKVASRYNWRGWSLSAGVIHHEQPPWWYISAWLFNQIPVLLLCLSVLGIWVSLRALRTASVSGKNGDASNINFGARNVVALYVLIALIIVVPLGAVLRHSIMYDGIRQILFIIPIWSTMSIIGLWGLVRYSKRAGRFTAVATTASYAVFALAILIPTVDQYRLFPYNYAYFNEYATLQAIDGRWSTDYWQTSFRELAPKIPREGLLDCRFQSSFGWLNNGRLEIRARRRPEEGCKSGVITPFSAPLKDMDQARNRSNTPFWIIHENRLGLLVPPNCVIEDKVTRPLRNQTLTMSWIARCNATPEMQL